MPGSIHHKTRAPFLSLSLSIFLSRNLHRSRRTRRSGVDGGTHDSKGSISHPAREMVICGYTSGVCARARPRILVRPVFACRFLARLVLVLLLPFSLSRPFLDRVCATKAQFWIIGGCEMPRVRPAEITTSPSAHLKLGESILPSPPR